VDRASFSLKEYDASLYERRMNAVTQYTIGSALAAIRQAGLGEEERKEAGFVYGTSRGSSGHVGQYLQSVMEKGPEFASSIYFPHSVINSVAGTAAKKLGLHGFNSSFSTGGNE